MRKAIQLSFLTIVLLACSDVQDDGVQLLGLQEPVEIIRDQWGINHIYAQNQHDLFYAQGYAAARDRLFQFEIWRRQATGTVAEILGERELKRDIGTRLFKFRGDMNEELNYYHDEGEEIVSAYVDGVNAYIAEAIEKNNLPLEFELLGIVPQNWTPEVVISRHQGLLGNITQELNYGRAVAKIGADDLKELVWFHPKEPQLELDPSIKGELLDDNILELYRAYRRSVRFSEEDLTATAIADRKKLTESELLMTSNDEPAEHYLNLGSNNWIVSGDKTASGHTVMANDPHRSIAVPSLRYMAHLVAPGWNVIGGGEPEIPGISIGHNEFGAWGLTVFRTDGEDLYVYDLNPKNLNQYSFKGEWQDMEVIKEAIPLKNSTDTLVELRYTRHGPVTYIDSVNNKAYAVRCAWLEPGGAPYLASLRMDQATTWDEFRAACAYSNIPGENMIWAGKDGTIGWQAVGIAPIRNNHSGLVPVPGDGRYEWDGYLPILDKPNMVNPASGYFATANQNVTPEEYQHWSAIGFNWSDPYRGDRVSEVLAQEGPLTISMMESLQTDYLSIPARTLIPYLEGIDIPEKFAREALAKLGDWDFILTPSSVAAAIYVEWENEIRREAVRKFVPDEVRGLFGVQLTRIIEWIENPALKFGNPTSRDEFLTGTFTTAISKLTERLGSDMDYWQYGQAKNKHIKLNHALGRIVGDSLGDILNVGPAPRGGNATTPGSTGSNYNQSSGASFRLIVDTGDWDSAVGTNTPGQSGDPTSPYYKNLFATWAADEYFPVLYSKEKIQGAAAEKTMLFPAKN